jgi:hypothetical protein
MLAKDPADRPTAADIAGGALRSQYEARTTAVAPGPAIAAPAVIAQPTTPLVPVVAPRPDDGRRKVFLAAGIALVAMAATLTAVLLLNNNGPNLPSTNDVNPNPGVSSSTTGSGPTTAPTTSDTGGTTQATHTTTPTPTPTSSPTPSTTPTTPSTTPQSPSPSTPSKTPTPTRPTPSPTPTTSQTQPTTTPPPPTATTTPSVNEQNVGTTKF